MTEISSEIHCSMKDATLYLLIKPALESTRKRRKSMSMKNRFTRTSIVIAERFLGDKTKVAAARKLFEGWKPIRDEVVSLIRSGDRESDGCCQWKKL